MPPRHRMAGHRAFHPDDGWQMSCSSKPSNRTCVSTSLPRSCGHV